MSRDEDIAASLPPPPLPAPARREAAIAEAMRRFDGGPTARPAGRRRTDRPASWWPRLNRPYAGAMVGAALVALVALPFAWTSTREQAPMEKDNRSSDVTSETMRPVTAFEAQDAGAPPEAAAAPAAIARNDAQPVPEAPADARDAAPEPDALAQAPPPQAMARMAERARSEAAPGAQHDAPAAPSSYGLVAEARRASPVAEAEVAADEERESANIVVTGSRVASRKAAVRGDWNACTIEDPGRSLRACRNQVNPAAKGASGRAAARIADGLERAWEGDLDEAIEAFDKAIAVAPKSSLAYLNRGLAYRKSGDLDRAIADLDQAVRYGPSARAYYQRSLVLRQRGDRRRASADERRAIDLDPRYDNVIGSGR